MDHTNVEDAERGGLAPETRFDESFFMWMPSLNLDLVHCFVTVVETGGFTQASRRLHLTQSAITQKIKRLENLLRRRLFVRTIKPLELSTEGEILLTYAPRLLGLSREMVQRVSEPPQNEALRLGIVEQFGYHFLPVWLPELKREWPDVRLVSDMSVSIDLLKGLEEDRFDLVAASAGYTTTARSKSASLLEEQHLQKERLVWVQAEKSKIDSKKDPLPLVMLGPLSRYRPIAFEALRKEGRSWEIVFDSKLISVFRPYRRLRWFPGLNSWGRTGVFPHSPK
jgi:DNA-binding transcriptional LysR family regulator